MANWEFVFVYDQEFADWLTEQGYPHPAVLPGNRLPTTAEMKAALVEQGNLKLDFPEGDDAFYVFRLGEDRFEVCIDGFDWSDDEYVPNECFRIRWMGELQAAILTDLTKSCGQLYSYPESGASAIIFPTKLDPKSLADLDLESEQSEDDWQFVFERLYRTR